MKITMIANILIKCVLMVCITVAAIHFNRVGVLWWFVLVPFVGYDYKSTPINKGGE